MADEDRSLDITGYETPDSDSDFKASDDRISTLEQENRQFLHDKEILEKKLTDLKQSLDESTKAREELEMEFQKAKSEVKTLESVAARAAELETDVSRLQHELITTMSAYEDSNSELSKVKIALDEAKKSESDKRVELEAVVNERDLLMKKCSELELKEKEAREEIKQKHRELEVKESETREVITGKEKEMKNWKEKIEELKLNMENSSKEKEEIESARNLLERMVVELKTKLADMRDKLDEKEISGTESMVMNGKGNGKGSTVNGNQVEWPVIVSSVVGAVGLVGVVYYLRYAKRS